MLSRAALLMVATSGWGFALTPALGCSPSSPAASDAGLDGSSDVPHLTALSVTSASGASPAIVLLPPFSPNIHDYAVRCAAGSNALTVAMTASAGATAALREPTRSPSAPRQTLSVDADENQAIVVVVTAGATRIEYWVRCLPHDFPTLTMTPHPEAGAPPPGYYLLATSRVPPNEPGSYALVLDQNGVPVWYTHGPTGEGIQDVDDVVEGAISFLPQGSAIQVHHLDPLQTTFPAPSGVPHDQHELRVLPNGHFLVISPLVRRGVDLTGIHVGLPDGGVEALGPSSLMADCDIVEFDPKTGDVAWTWVGSEHFSPQLDAIDPELDRGPGGKPVMDMFHCNSIDVDPANGNLLVSSRDLNSIFYIERKSGTILWKMGGKPYTKEHATYVPVADPFYRQHDARLLPGWSSTCGGQGQISVFDDHTSEPGPARALVLDVVVAGDGGAAEDCGTAGATVAWQYAGLANSSVMGSFRISADGSRVIGWGASSAPQPTFTEVDVAGNDEVDFYFAEGLAAYRVVKVPTNAFDLGLLRRTAGLP